MTIDVVIQDEQGNALARYDGPPLGLTFLKLSSPGSMCFQFIVPWGDTTFNHAQIAVLLAELRDAKVNSASAMRLQELKALITFIEGATGTHVYVKFIGD